MNKDKIIAEIITLIRYKNKDYEVRDLINYLCNELDKRDNIIKEDRTKQNKEIERLNNIINELNYGIKELDNMFYETFRISQNGYYSISEWELKEFTDKLQELKGDKNNDN